MKFAGAFPLGFLTLTPTERLERHQRALEFYLEVRRV